MTGLFFIVFLIRERIEDMGKRDLAAKVKRQEKYIEKRKAAVEKADGDVPLRAAVKRRKRAQRRLGRSLRRAGPGERPENGTPATLRQRRR